MKRTKILKATPTLCCNHAHLIENEASTKPQLMSLYLSKSCINTEVTVCMSITGADAELS